MKFNTPAAALMYLNSLGWELYVNGSISEGITINGSGGSSTTSYWIMRKPCTKEEFDKAVEDGIRKLLQKYRNNIWEGCIAVDNLVMEIKNMNGFNLKTRVRY